MYFACLAIQLMALAAVLLHLIAPLLPEETAWSVWHYTILPVPIAWLGGLAVAALVLPPVNDAVGRWFSRLGAVVSDKSGVRPTAGNRQLWFAAIAIGMALPFWLFRIRHQLWGDAHFIVRLYPTPAPTARFGRSTIGSRRSAFSPTPSSGSC